MFNAEKLLGGMLKQSLGIKGLGTKASIGAGLLGIAFAAAEHFMNNTHGRSPAGSVPPPPPSGLKTAPPPPPVSQPSSAQNREQDAALLVRAMIASAAADGEIDEQERHKIINRFESVTLSVEERQFIQKELASPCSIDVIVSQVNRGELARQVYAASLMAIHLDTEAERNYLKTLAEKLKLDPTVIDKIHDELGISK